jgi:hypothetical protein
MNEMNDEVKPYTVAQLVMIGDHIHNCKTAFIFVDNPIGEEHNVLITTKGDYSDLVALLVEVMLREGNIASIVKDACINYDYQMMQKEINN